MLVSGHFCIHRASSRTSPALDTFGRVRRHAEQREPIPEAVPKPEGTKEPAKRTIHRRRCDQKQDKQRRAELGHQARRLDKQQERQAEAEQL